MSGWGVETVEGGVVRRTGAEGLHTPTIGVFSIEGNLTEADAYLSGEAVAFQTGQAFQEHLLRRVRTLAEDPASGSARALWRYHANVTLAEPEALLDLGRSARAASAGDGLGTAMVYPTLLAAIGDVAHPSWRASAVGVYRLWRDLGYAVGALLAGITADSLGVRPAVVLVAGVTAASGLVVAWRLRETLRRQPDACVEPNELRRRREAGERVLALDVRSAAEFAQGHVEGAVNVPLDRLETESTRFDATVPVVTICDSGGGRSETAARVLRERGFRDVRSLCGGTAAWRSLEPTKGASS